MKEGGGGGRGRKGTEGRKGDKKRGGNRERREKGRWINDHCCYSTGSHGNQPAVQAMRSSMNLVRSLMMIVSLHWMRASRKSSSPSASKCIPGVCVCVCVCVCVWEGEGGSACMYMHVYAGRVYMTVMWQSQAQMEHLNPQFNLVKPKSTQECMA